jgi:hypothetical protein
MDYIKTLVNLNYLGFKVLAAVIMKNYVFWNITRCSLLKVNRHFGVIYFLHRHGLIII